MKMSKDNQLDILIDLMKDKWGENAYIAFAGLLSTVVSENQLQVLIDNLNGELDV